MYIFVEFDCCVASYTLLTNVMETSNLLHRVRDMYTLTINFTILPQLRSFLLLSLLLQA